MNSPSILICDDSIGEVRVIVSALRNQSYRIIIANNGREACDRASLLQPDLILMDVRMPLMDGFAACRLLKAHKDTEHIPVVFLTAATDLDDRLGGLRAGAIDYIVKPANEEEVRLRVAAQLARNWMPPQAQVNASLNEPRSVSAPNALVRAFIRLLEETHDDESDVDILISRIGASRQSLNDAFRTALGASIYEWLRDQRMKRACYWLIHSESSIGQISDDLAYSNSGNFATAFRERYGMSPRDFRKLTISEPSEVCRYWQPVSMDLPLKANPWFILERALASGSSGGTQSEAYSADAARINQASLWNPWPSMKRRL